MGFPISYGENMGVLADVVVVDVDVYEVVVGYTIFEAPLSSRRTSLSGRRRSTADAPRCTQGS